MVKKKIEYHKGQTIGPYGLKYIKEAEPYIQPSNGKKVRQAYFECPFCDDHKIFITRIAYAKNGHTKSCGCKALEASIKTIERYNANATESWNHIYYKPGDVIGDFGVIYLNEEERYVSPEGAKYRKAKFQCPICGNSFVSLIGNVSSGKTKGCGFHQSYGEEKLNSILSEIGINFERQKTFDDLKGKNGHPLFFDFYLPDYNTCIEYDGEQHFKYHESSCWNTEENYFETQKRDKQKDSYCKAKGINLIRIPYTDFENINKKYISQRL